MGHVCFVRQTRQRVPHPNPDDVMGQPHPGRAALFCKRLICTKRAMAISQQPAAWETFLYKPHSWLEPLKWDEVFAPIPRLPSDPNSAIRNPQSAIQVHIDLGAGDGGFIRARAKNHPDIRFLGVERLLGRVRKIARGALRESLPNLRALRIEASYAVEHLFPPASVTSITILFPDPWPKRRHHKNRLVQTPLLHHCARALRPNGWLAIKTDDAPYFEHIREALTACDSLKIWTEADAATLLPEPTDFERDFVKEGRPIHFIAARPVRNPTIARAM